MFWIEHGVTIFRVDNPHTKPVGFWEWLIAKVKATNPEVIFLAEAFTRPKMMKALAKAGFTQSYTYFTWRNEKRELEEYLTELTQTEMRDYFIPNFFTNTPRRAAPDLAKGGLAGVQDAARFRGHACPRRTGSTAGTSCAKTKRMHGKEEYLDSEKFEIKPRDYEAPGNLNDFIEQAEPDSRREPRAARARQRAVLEERQRRRHLLRQEHRRQLQHALGRREPRPVRMRTTAR